MEVLMAGAEIVILCPMLMVIIFGICLPLNAGSSIEYKFTVDGWTDQEQFAGGEPYSN